MKKFLVGLGFMLICGFVLVGCEGDNETPIADETVEVETPDAEVEVDGDVVVLDVLASFSVIADMIGQVGGQHVVVTTIVPIGEEPEEYEFTPGDVINATNADVIFYNGFDLEHEYDWFEELMATAGRVKDVDFFALTDGLPGVRLLTEGLQDYYDPHLWMSPLLGMGYVDNIITVLSNILPEAAEYFASNGAAFNAEIYAVYTEWNDRFTEIPADMLLVTTEGAFRYFGYAFGINTEFIWEFNSEDEGTPEQFVRIIDIVNQGNVPYLFIESSVGPDYMAQVSEETGVAIWDGYLFTDSLSEAGGPAATYLAFLRHNLETIYAALMAE